MIPRTTLILIVVCGSCVAVSSSAAAQETQDNQPRIQPRSDSAPSSKSKKPQQQEQQPSQQQDQEQQPKQQQPQVPAASEQQGESSSKDSQIDFSGASHPNLPVPSGDEADDKAFRPWDPHRADKDVEVGTWYLKLKNYRAALERFNDALVYKPNDAEATFGLAVTQEKLDLFAQARKTYSKYLEILPEGPRAKECHEALKRLESRAAAASATDEAAKQAADDIAAGETFLARNNFDAARERFEDALRLTPDNAKACYRLAQSLKGMQRPEPSRLYYQKYLELDPRGPYADDARKAIADLNFVLSR
jgi:tetratricopeptide (TPR) repeat protein